MALRRSSFRAPLFRDSLRVVFGLNGFGLNALTRLAPSLSNARTLPAPRGMCPQTVSPPCPVSGLSPGPWPPEGGGAPVRRRTSGHLWEGAPPAAVSDRRAFRRSTAAIFGTITALLRRTEGRYPSRYPGSIRAALHPNVSKPLKAAPSSGADGDRASWDLGFVAQACRRRHPRSADRTTPEDALGERGWRHDRLNRGGVNFNGEFARSINTHKRAGTAHFNW